MEKTFYIASVLDGVQTFATISLVFAAALLVISIAVTVFSLIDYGSDDYVYKSGKKTAKLAAIAVIILSLVCIFTPSANTYLHMKEQSDAVKNEAKN